MTEKNESYRIGELLFNLGADITMSFGKELEYTKRDIRLQIKSGYLDRKKEADEKRYLELFGDKESYKKLINFPTIDLEKMRAERNLFDRYESIKYHSQNTEQASDASIDALISTNPDKAFKTFQKFEDKKALSNFLDKCEKEYPGESFIAAMIVGDDFALKRLAERIPKESPKIAYYNKEKINEAQYQESINSLIEQNPYEAFKIFLGKNDVTNCAKTVDFLSEVNSLDENKAVFKRLVNYWVQSETKLSKDKDLP